MTSAPISCVAYLSKYALTPSEEMSRRIAIAAGSTPEQWDKAHADRVARRAADDRRKAIGDTIDSAIYRTREQIGNSNTPDIPSAPMSVGVQIRLARIGISAVALTGIAALSLYKYFRDRKDKKPTEK